METLSPLLNSLRRCCEALPELRRPGPNTRYAMADFGLAAFSVFFMQSPSFLAHQRQLEQGQGRSNCQTLFGMAAIPCDNQIRAMLDPVDPALFFPVFTDVMGALERTGGLAEFRRLQGRVLIALDGTEYFRSTRLHCAHCSTQVRGGRTEYFHTLLSAALVAPGHQRVVPLEPEFIVPQDGHDKQDCESRAAGSTGTPAATPASTRSTSATTSTPASRCARRCAPPAAISCSCASQRRTRPSRSI
jgi:hypothetical protein